MPKPRGEGKPYKETRTRKVKDKKTGEVKEVKYTLWAWKIELDRKPDGTRDYAVVRRKNRNDLADAKNELLVKIATGAPLKKDTTTVAAWLEYWLDEIAKPRLRPRVWRDYRSAVRCNIIPHIGKVRMVDLEPRHVRHMIKKITDSGLKLRSAEVAYLRLHKALDDAKREPSLGITSNVVELVDKPQPKTNGQDAAHPQPLRAITANGEKTKGRKQRSRKSLTSEQARKVIRTALDDNDPLAARWAMALLTGSRQGETIGLTLDRIDLEKGTMDLSWALQVVPLAREKGEKLPAGDLYPIEAFDAPEGFEIWPLYRATCLVRPKTNKSVRLVPVPMPLLVLLRAHIEQMKPNKYGLVWANPAGKPLRPEDDRKQWAAAMARAGAPDVVLHAARHTTATLLLEAGVPEDVRMAIMGHSSAAAQRIYAHVDQEVKRAGLSSIGGVALAS
ncbi:tyrosine-type recombinase/integrase [Nocardia salmonicida]|uniref:tyrosine-type recombinase/integrase n=1 Tax=Nocardia salmonicida TaxID=53431 RepID=UPI00363D0DCC